MRESGEMTLDRSRTAKDDTQLPEGQARPAARLDTSARYRRYDSRGPLAGRRVPTVHLPFVEGAELDLSVVAKRFPLVICLFGSIDMNGPSCSDGRRLLGWIRHGPRLARTGHRLIAISSETFIEQARWLQAAPDWIVLSDPGLLLARALPLLTVADEHSWTYRPMTLITESGHILRSFQPVDAADAEIVTRWLEGLAPVGAPTEDWRRARAR
jgi:hypothetical protein